MDRQRSAEGRARCEDPDPPPHGDGDLGGVLEQVVTRARTLVDARGVLVLLRDGERLRVAALAGRLGDGLLEMTVPAGELLRSGRAERLARIGGPLRVALGERLDARTGLLVPLVCRDRALGLLSAFDRSGGAEFTSEDARLLESFAVGAATAVATAQRVAGEGLRRSIEASERERQRWARELHDETLQELAGLKVLLSGARRLRDPDAIDATLRTALEQIDTEITGLRRLIADLRPAALDAFGIQSALEGLAERVTATSDVEVELEVSLPRLPGHAEGRLPAALEDALYRLAQEALTNVVKHAGAGRAAVALACPDDTVELTVCDDGRGFARDRATGGFGLLGMEERVALAGGRLTVDAAPGAGTTVRARLPLGDGGPA